MSNPRDLPPIPGVKANSPSPADLLDQSTKDNAKAEKSRATEADNHLKAWNEELRKIFINSYATNGNLNKFSYHKEGTLDLNETNSIVTSKLLGADLQPGRWNAKRGGAKILFDIVVDENSNVATNPRAVGKGYRAHEDAAKLTIEFLKQTGATSIQLNIQNFDGYTSNQIYKMTRIYIEAALKAGLGVTLGAVVQSAVDGLSLTKRDELLGLQREANAASFSREREVFTSLATKLAGAVGLNTSFMGVLDVARDDPEKRIDAISKYSDKLEELEANIRLAKERLKSYLDVIDVASSSEKTTEKDIDRLKSNIADSKERREQLVAAVDVAEEYAVKLRSELEKELNNLSPGSELVDPSSAKPEEKSEVDVSQLDKEPLLPSEPLATTLDVSESSIAMDENDEASPKAAPLDAAVDLSSPGAGADTANHKEDAPVASAGGEGEVAAEDKDKSKNKGKEPVSLSEQQESKVNKVRDKLKASTLSEDGKARRDNEWATIASKNSETEIDKLLALNANHQSQKKLG